VGSRGGAVLIVLLVAAGAALILVSQPERRPYVESGVRAPDFSLPRVGEEGVRSLESYRGQVVLLNFWATWCKPCEEEMPAMERLYRSLADVPFELVAVSVDESPGPVEAFRERYGITFPILLDAEQEAARAYQTFRFPESFLIDGQGEVVHRYVGPRDWDAPEYEARIRELASVLR